MREQKRIPKISSAVKRLIATEALKNPDLPRDYLAQSLIEKIRAMGEIPPTEETLKRRISEARKNPPKIDKTWHLGEQFAHNVLPPGAIPRIFEIQRILKKETGKTVKIPTIVALWIGQLHEVIENPGYLLSIAYAYALYVALGMAADPKNKEVPVDTTELDDLLINGDYEALSVIAAALLELISKHEFQEVAEQLKDGMRIFKTILDKRTVDK